MRAWVSHVQRRALLRWNEIRRQINRRVSLLSGSVLNVNEYEDQRLGAALANKIVRALLLSPFLSSPGEWRGAGRRSVS